MVNSNLRERVDLSQSMYMHNGIAVVLMITYSTTRTELETKTLMTERKHVN